MLRKIIALAVATSAIWASSASAASFPVTNTDDSGAGSLRAAIADAQASSGPDEIPIEASGAVLLETALPTIDQDTEIVGPGAEELTVRRVGAADFRIFTVGIGGATVEISGLTISHGRDPASGGGGVSGAINSTLVLSDLVVTQNLGRQGGGVASSGTLEISDSVVTDNVADSASNPRGGGLRVVDATITDTVVSGNQVTGASGGTGGGIDVGGSLTMLGGEVSGNTAPDDGGGIHFDPIGSNELSVTGTRIAGNAAGDAGGGLSANNPVTIGASTITANTAAGSEGGGLLLSGASAQLADTTISGNAAPAGGGGGISSGGALSLTRSTVSGNSAGVDGGGVVQFGALPVAVRNSTLSGNRAEGSGGGVHLVDGATTINNATIARNVADSDNAGGGNGGGLAQVAPATVDVSNSVLVENDTLGGSGDNCNGQLASATHTAFTESATCNATITTGSIAGGSPIGNLLENGGPTRTHALLAGNAAIDAGYPGSGPGTACEATDQRGLPRGASSGRCDMGAFEVVPAVQGTSQTPAVAPPAGTENPECASLRRQLKKAKTKKKKRKIRRKLRRLGC